METIRYFNRHITNNRKDIRILSLRLFIYLNIAKRLKLTPKQQRELHDLIHGENLGYQEILDLAKNWFNE